MLTKSCVATVLENIPEVQLLTPDSMTFRLHALFTGPNHDLFFFFFFFFFFGPARLYTHKHQMKCHHEFSIRGRKCGGGATYHLK